MSSYLLDTTLALQVFGAWPLSGLRQSFLNGALTRLLDPDSVLKRKVCEFVGNGEFGLGSGQRSDGTFERVWFHEPIDPADVMFDKDVFLLTKAVANKLTTSPPPPTLELEPTPPEPPATDSGPSRVDSPDSMRVQTTSVIRVTGAVPPEVWNRLGTKLFPKLRACTDLRVDIEFSAKVDSHLATGLATEINQALDELGVRDKVEVKLGTE